jgi:hypothetical protein
VAWWTAEGQEVDRARRALRVRRLAASDREGPFAAIIRCTASGDLAGNTPFRRSFNAMELSTTRTSRPRSWPKAAVPYSNEAMRQDLDRVRNAWEDCQANRDRSAIYRYLNAVYDLVAWWSAEGQEIDRARRALRLQRLNISDREDPFAAVIRCTADPAKADKRTRSKWSRLMRYAAMYKPDSEPLGDFIKRKGGIIALDRMVAITPSPRCSTSPQPPREPSSAHVVAQPPLVITTVVA